MLYWMPLAESLRVAVALELGGLHFPSQLQGFGPNNLDDQLELAEAPFSAVKPVEVFCEQEKSGKGSS